MQTQVTKQLLTIPTYHDKRHFEVPDVEHIGDLEHFTSIIQDAGGEIVKVNWSGEEDDAAYIIYQCQDKNHQKQILDKLENE